MLQGFGPQLLAGLAVTVQVALVALGVGLILGLGGGIAKVYGNRAVRGVAEAYTTVFRGLPEFLVILIAYFGGSLLLAQISEDVELNAFTAGSLALATTFGAYATEVFRGAFQSVPAGQIEAGRAVGLSGVKIMRRIVLPQVWRLALPGLGNLFLSLLKDTALVSVIGVEDLMRKADVARSVTKDSFTMYAAAAVLYLILTAASTVILHLLERRANRGIRRTA